MHRFSRRDELIVPGFHYLCSFPTTQRGIPLPQSPPEALIDRKEIRFHVKQAPVEKLPPMLCTFGQQTLTVGREENQRQRSRQHRRRRYRLAIAPDSQTCLSVFQSKSPYAGLPTQISQNSKPLRPSPYQIQMVPGPKGAANAEQVHGLEHARLAASVEAIQHVEPGAWRNVDRLQYSQVPNLQCLDIHDPLPDRHSRFRAFRGGSTGSTKIQEQLQSRKQRCSRDFILQTPTPVPHARAVFSGHRARATTPGSGIGVAPLAPTTARNPEVPGRTQAGSHSRHHPQAPAASIGRDYRKVWSPRDPYPFPVPCQRRIGITTYWHASPTSGVIRQLLSPSVRCSRANLVGTTLRASMR